MGQGPVLEHPDGAGPLPHDPGHLLGGEPGHHPQEHHLRLIGGEGGDAGQGGRRRHAFQCFFLGATRSNTVNESLSRHRLGPPPSGSPPEVDQTAPGDGEDPPAEVVLVPPEPGEASGHVQPGLRGKILPLARVLRAQVSKDGWMQVSVQAGHCPLGPGLGRRQDRFEPFAEGH